ncbi:glutaconate CoA transferase subunit B [Mycolicibacterium mageritense DSM 44476 = CIP 104973]|uniref:3-oxoadipate--succinyl-CoA transferase subunit B n=1 Tax=Mycolicibacterium mageritense TaxID=53462 RepID=A0ABM7I5Y8_MYCME|nr:CoA-transferase [Mycolicibacterium mageritense]MCC9186865.1 CoA-transferase subunit beta [Mycolicibacterium mageritense]BBX38355.1 3-oxoadipate--succinyl-CoA transferase subunit B [Mycolicibacterium mageritense]CDO26912.1 acyl CoA:acetate/3-ketoacid CoA transferase subunit beta [Mycolicibacterium mageritense DSM 44476 = CIP 104973]
MTESLTRARPVQHPDARPDEIMTIAASRLLEDGKVLFAGIGQPLVAAAIAKRRQAPNLTVLLEGGMIGIELQAGELPASTNEVRAAIGAQMLTTATDIFLMAQRGFFDYGFIGVAQVDQYGNVNTSVVGDPAKPAVRLPGPGGANDIASMCNEVVVVTPHEPRRFVERVDFITSPGFLTGTTSRRDSGLLYGGPRWVVTDLALLDFAPDSRRMRVRALQAGVTLDQVRAATGFELLVHDQLDELPPVDDAELALLRHLVDGEETQA